MFIFISLLIYVAEIKSTIYKSSEISVTEHIAQIVHELV
jgi:hypothetical protein